MRKTYRDRLILGLCIAPPIALVLFGVTAAARWQVNSDKIRAAAQQSFEPELLRAPSPAAMEYDERTSSEFTKTYRELIAGLDALNDKYSSMFSLVEEDQDWFNDLSTERPTEKFVRAYLQEAAPHMRLLKELHGQLESTWTPHETGNPNTYVGAIVAGRGLSDLVRLDFREAVRSKETARAIEAFELFQRMQNGPSTLDSQQMLPLVTESMTTGVWSDQELEQIAKLIKTNEDLDQLWKFNVRGGILGQLPWLLTGKAVVNYRPDPIPRTYAPSGRIAWFEKQQRYLGVRGLGTYRAFKKVSKIQSEDVADSRSGIDTAIQVPVYGDDRGRGGSKEFMARMYCAEANQRRLARTAVAIAKYKNQNDAFPERLDQLIQVGLDPYDMLDPLERQFHFKSDGEQCTLSNASEWFQPRFGSSMSFGDTPQTLGSLLQEYREVTFQNQN